MMVVVVGLLLDVSPVRLVIFLLALINLSVVVWYVRESIFEKLNAPEPAQELVAQAR